MATAESVELTVQENGIHCGGCESRIEGVLAKLQGVRAVKADHRTQKITLSLDQERTPLKEVLAKLEFLGYSASHSAGLSSMGAVAPQQPVRPPVKKRWHAVCSLCTGGVSVVCMSSMGVAAAAAGAAAGAAATSMAGMGGVGAMAGPQPSFAQTSAFFLVPRLFESVGLRFLNHVPNEVAQPFLVLLLGLSVGTGYLAYRAHRQPQVLALTVASGLAMYVSIYVWMSEAVYFLSLPALLAAGIWGLFLARKPEKAGG